VKPFFLFFFIIIAISIVGCAPKESTPTGEVTLEKETVSTSVTVDQETKITSYEVYLTEDGFFPASYHAKEGDMLRLVFVLDEPHFITIDQLGIAESIQGAVLEFTPQQGSYDMICEDCEEPFVAEIIVK
jgi:hypothetical protein